VPRKWPQWIASSTEITLVVANEQVKVQAVNLRIPYVEL